MKNIYTNFLKLKKMKKTYFRLIERNYILFKKKEEEKHKGMHNLSWVFIKRGDNLESEGKKCMSITILYKMKNHIFSILKKILKLGLIN